MTIQNQFENGASDFRMFRHSVVESIISLKENNRFSKGIFSWVGYKTKYMEYTVEDRHSGKSNFNLKNSFKYAWNGIVNFSVKPLKIATGIVGEYISKMYLEIKSRPIYVAKNTLGFDDDIL